MQAKQERQAQEAKQRATSQVQAAAAAAARILHLEQQLQQQRELYAVSIDLTYLPKFWKCASSHVLDGSWDVQILADNDKQGTVYPHSSETTSSCCCFADVLASLQEHQRQCTSP